MIKQTTNVLQKTTHAPWGTLLLIGAALFCLGIFAAVAEDVVEKDPIVQFDSLVANAFHDAATPASTAVFEAITALGNQGINFVIVLFALYCVWRRHWLLLVDWLAVAGLGIVLNYLLKHAFVRTRPVFITPIVTEAGFSFPSGHAMSSTIVFGFLAYLICLKVRCWPRRLLVIVSTVLLVFMIGLSRVVLGAHYLSDVISGFAAGGLWLIVGITSFNLIRFYVDRTSINQRSG